MSKIIRNLSKMNWLAAIGEVVLIFIGVVAALWFENWNDERKERKDEVEILTELREDFRFNDRELKKKVAQLMSLEINCSLILQSTGEKSEGLSPQKADSLLLDLQDLHTFDSRETALGGLVNSGRLNIISAPELRRSLSQWEVTLADAQEEVPLCQSILREHLLPYLGPRISWRSVNASVNAQNPYFRDHRPVFRELRFENLIWQYRKNIAYLIEEYRPLQSEIAHLLEMLDAEIKKLSK